MPTTRSDLGGQPLSRLVTPLPVTMIPWYNTRLKQETNYFSLIGRLLSRKVEKSKGLTDFALIIRRNRLTRRKRSRVQSSRGESYVKDT